MNNTQISKIIDLLITNQIEEVYTDFYTCIMYDNDHNSFFVVQSKGDWHEEIKDLHTIGLSEVYTRLCTGLKNFTGVVKNMNMSLNNFKL